MILPVAQVSSIWQNSLHSWQVNTAKTAILGKKWYWMPCWRYNCYSLKGIKSLSLRAMSSCLPIFFPSLDKWFLSWRMTSLYLQSMLGMKMALKPLLQMQTLFIVHPLSYSLRDLHSWQSDFHGWLQEEGKESKGKKLFRTLMFLFHSKNKDINTLSSHQRK